VNDDAKNSAHIDSKRCVAVAYEWFLTPVDFHDYDIVLNIGCFDSTKPEPWTRTYHARLPRKRSSNQQSDVSGNLGIIFPVSDDDAGKRASASERLVADAIIWELAQLDFGDTKTILLLQGPMLPKLRGRLLYRGVPKDVAIWTLTWQPEWFWRLEASEQLLRSIEEPASVSAMYPPEGIDRASRCWVCRRAEKAVYHFEVLTNTWDCVEALGWEKEYADEIASLIKPVKGDVNERLPLPSVLERARAAAKTRCALEEGFVWFLPQLREKKHDARGCATDERLAKVIRCIDPQAAETAGEAELFAATELFEWKNEANVYTAFRMNEGKLLSVLRGS